MRPPFRRSLLLAAWLAPALTSCARGERGSASNFRGVVLSPAVEKPDFVLTDTNREAFNFRLQTAGKVTLLFFGYTHCPDVCPLHAANVAAVLGQMPFAERDLVRFVFVTTDPARDTPERLGEWLGAFDRSFIGLTGPIEQVNELQASLHMAPARRDPAAGDSANYLVGHSAQVLAFGVDGLARLEYPFGIRQEDWANDLPRLVRGEAPADPFPEEVAAAGAAPAAIEVEQPILPRPPTTTEASVYLTVRNLPANDTLVAVFSPFAASAMVHGTSGAAGGSLMGVVERLPVPGDGVLRFAPGGYHLMLGSLMERPALGQAVPLTLRFAKAGDLVFAATVVDYAEVERLLTTGAR